MGAYTYSGTAASNTTVDGIGAAGSDSPDNIDNLVRALAAADANFVKDLGGYNTVAGTADAITITLADASTISNYTDKLIGFVAGSDNSSASVTLGVDGIAAEPIKKAVQGVETALIAGDIQSGGYYLVRWRSTWDSGGGAWELLDPSAYTLPASPTFTTIELGAAATDTTLSRSAAGVMAVEGNVVPSPGSQAEHDILVRGASSWNRLAVGTEGHVLKVSSGSPTWGAVGSTFDTVQATTSGTAFNFTIPAGVREIFVGFDGVSLSGNDQILIQIGPSGTPETTGYVSSAIWTSNSASSTSGFIVGDNDTSAALYGIANIVNITGNTWIMSCVGRTRSNFGTAGGGAKTVASAPNILRVTRTGSNTFDGGQVNIWYR